LSVTWNASQVLFFLSWSKCSNVTFGNWSDSISGLNACSAHSMLCRQHDASTILSTHTGCTSKYPRKHLQRADKIPKVFLTTPLLVTTYSNWAHYSINSNCCMVKRNVLSVNGNIFLHVFRRWRHCYWSQSVPYCIKNFIHNFSNSANS